MTTRSKTIGVGTCILIVLGWWMLSRQTQESNRQRAERAQNQGSQPAIPIQAPESGLSKEADVALPRQQPQAPTRDDINRYLKMLANVELPPSAHTFTEGSFTIPVADIPAFVKQLNLGLDLNNEQKWWQCGVSSPGGEVPPRPHDGLRYSKGTLQYTMVPAKLEAGKRPGYHMTLDPATGAAYFGVTENDDE